jgi:uncharacterized protein (DUF342 family)
MTPEERFEKIESALRTAAELSVKNEKGMETLLQITARHDAALTQRDDAMAQLRDLIQRNAPSMKELQQVTRAVIIRGSVALEDMAKSMKHIQTLMEGWLGSRPNGGAGKE